jgi:hypothetical protein
MSPGRQSASSATWASCPACPRGTYAANRGQGQCIPCPYRLSSPVGGTTCNVCDTGFYLLDETVSPSELQQQPGRWCLDCAPHAHCEWNTTLATLNLTVGHWRLSERSRVITACRGGNGAERCLGGVQVHAGENGENYCDASYTGPECRLCRGDEHLYHQQSTGRCLPCPGIGRSLAVLSGLVVALVALLVAYAYYGEKLVFVVKVRRFLAWLNSYARSAGLQTKLKILFSFYGIAVSLDTTYDAKMPEEYETWVHNVFHFAKINWLSLLLPSQCSPIQSAGSRFRTTLLVKTVVPLLVILVATVGSTCRTCIQLGWSRRNLYVGVLGALPVALVVSFFFVPTVSTSIFESWLCVEYQADGSHPDSAPTVQSYLREDIGVRCSDSSYDDAEHDVITSIAFAFVFVWPIGMVLLYAAVLIPCGSSMRAHTPTHLTKATRFLHKDYTSDFYYWELIELCRRVVLLGWVMRVPSRYVLMRQLGALMISLVALTILLSTRPYARAEDTLIAATCQLALVFCFMGGLLIRIFHELELYLPHAIVQDIMVFTSELGIAVPLILITLTMLLVMISVVWTVLRREPRMPTIQVVETGMPPELTLVKGQKWHLFLSHSAPHTESRARAAVASRVVGS